MFDSFITVEGADGIGKSTQIELLTERFKRGNRSLRLYDFPSKSGNPIGNLIGSFLTGHHEGVSPEFLSLAFSIDRRHLLSDVLQEGNVGEIGIADRYVLSNIAFQCAKLKDEQRRNSLSELIEWVEYEVLGLPRPTLELVLVAPKYFFSEGLHLERSGSPNREYSGGNADVHEVAVDLQTTVNDFYGSLDESERLKKVEIFNTSGERKSAEKLHHEIWNHVSGVLGFSEAVGRLYNENR